MISVDPPLSGVNFISLMWAAPQFEPERYNLEYSCKFQSNGTVYIKKQRITVASDATFVSVPKLLPNSLCELTLFAVYNPASIDVGWKIHASTLKDNACKKFVALHPLMEFCKNHNNNGTVSCV